MTEAAERTLGVLERASEWLTTGVIAVRVGMHHNAAKRTLRQLARGGFVDRREDPEDVRAAQWRVRGPLAD